MKYLFSSLLLGLWAFSMLSAQFNIPDIADSLLDNAHTIIINDETQFSVKNRKESTFKRHYTHLLLNDNASEQRDVYITYDQFKRIQSGQVTLYNQNGKTIKEYRLKDFEDKSSVGNSVASDGRLKHLKISYDQYPFFIQASYEVDHSSSLHYPQWIAQIGEGVAVLNTELQVVYPKNLGIRHHSNTPVSDSTTLAQEKTLIWSINNLPAYQYEHFSGCIDDYSPIVYLAAKEVEVDGFKGRMDSWKSFGQWQNQLLDGKNDLKETDLKELKSRLVGIEDTKQKIAIVYDYLQENSRYVSIQLGIGGWQPFDASYVHEKKFGDCKALSFYTKSLLEEIGIPSHYTIIKAGSNQAEVLKDFSNAYFNHAILTVPLENDTIWLECTSQTNPCGYMGTFTSDRYALIITEEGGELIRTKAYSATESQQNTYSEVSFEEGNNLRVNLHRKYSGLEVENKGFNYYIHESSQNQKRWLYDMLPYNNHHIHTFNFQALSNEVVPEGTLKIVTDIEKGAKKMGQRLFIDMEQFIDRIHVQLPDQERSNDIMIKYPFTHTDTIAIEFPAGYQLESNIKNLQLDTQFGKYELNYFKEAEKNFYVRKLVLNKGHYPPKDYDALRYFFKQISQSDRQKIVLVSN